MKVPTLFAIDEQDAEGQLKDTRERIRIALLANLIEKMQQHESLKNHENKLDMSDKFLIDHDGIKSKQFIEYAKISLKIRSINKDNVQDIMVELYNSVKGGFSKIKDFLEYTKVELNPLDRDKFGETIYKNIARNNINTGSVINAFEVSFDEITTHKTNNRYGENREVTSKDIENHFLKYYRPS